MILSLHQSIIWFPKVLQFSYQFIMYARSFYQNKHGVGLFKNFLALSVLYLVFNSKEGHCDVMFSFFTIQCFVDRHKIDNKEQQKGQQD